MISPDDVAYYARFNTLKLIKPKSKTLQPLTFVDGSAFVSIFIYTARKLTIVSRANVIIETIRLSLILSPAQIATAISILLPTDPADPLQT